MLYVRIFWRDIDWEFMHFIVWSLKIFETSVEKVPFEIGNNYFSLALHDF
jgi:hypothetical protein